MEKTYAFKWRVIETWQSPHGIALFTHSGNLFNWEEMADPSPSTPLGRYINQVRDWGFNAMVVLGDPECRPDAMQKFAAYLKNKGISMFIRREWCETIVKYVWPVFKTHGPPLPVEKLCPYNDEVRSFWTNRIKRDYELIPDLAGHRFSCGEFEYTYGAPWLGDSPQSESKNGRDRTLEAIRYIAGLLKTHGKTLFWETCQDDPWGQRHEVYYYNKMTGEIPLNTFIVFKRNYWDFHSRWPLHPLYESISLDDNGHSPYHTSFQQAGEYRGSHDFPWCMVDEWSATVKEMVRTGQQGIWMMAIPQPEVWDHPLNLVNWYAFSWLMHDPHADPEIIKLNWAENTFCEELGSVVVEVLNKVTEAARGMFEFDGLWTAYHSRFPNLEYLDSRMCGPYRQHRRMTGMMGLALPLDMYESDKAAEIMADPCTHMVFNQSPITPQLKVKAMDQKERAIQLMNEAIELWIKLEGKIDVGKYQQILSGMKGNRNDTIIFYHGFDLYMDWKLGVLTEEKIDTALMTCRDLQGIIVPEPLDEHPEQVFPAIEPASLKTFAEQLRKDLREPWVEK